MIRDYNKFLQKLILNKISALNQKKFYEFYTESPELLSSFDIAAFILIQDCIININKTDKDVKTRYTSNIEKEKIDSIFDGKHFSEYFPNLQNYMTDGDNLWFIAALRNSFAHGGVKGIDYEKGVVIINNTHDFNKLEGEIPLSFFEKFCTFYKELQNENNRSEGFSFPLRDYFLGIKTPENLSNSKMDEIRTRIEIIYKDYFYGTQDINNISGTISKSEIEGIIVDALLPDKENTKDYGTLLKEQVEKAFKEKISKEFPNLEFYLLDIFNQTSAKEIKLFFSKMPHKTKGLSIEDSERLLPIFAPKNGIPQFIEEIFFLKQKLIENSNYLKVVENELSPKGLEYLKNVNSIDNLNAFSVILLGAIHQSRTEKGLSHTYDDIIIEELIKYPNGNHKKIFEYRSEEFEYVSNLVQNEINNSKSKEEIIELIKTKFPDFISNYSKMCSDLDFPSKEDKVDYSKLFDEEKILTFDLNHVLLKEKMLTGLLYTYGINVYVPNKAINDQSSEKPISYTFLDESKIKIYSSDTAARYKDKLLKVKSLKKSLARDIKHFNDVEQNDKFDPERKKIELIKTQKKINEDTQEIDEMQLEIESTNTESIVFEEKELMIEPDTEKKATFIRNCLAHEGKIEVLTDDLSEERPLLQLIDCYDTGSTTVGYITLEDLIAFISLDNHLQNENVSEKYTDEQIIDIINSTIFEVKKNIITQEDSMNVDVSDNHSDFNKIDDQNSERPDSELFQNQINKSRIANGVLAVELSKTREDTYKKEIKGGKDE